MPINNRDRATVIPGRSSLSALSFDPLTREAVRFIREVGGIYDLGIRFPFNNGSTTMLNQTSNATLSPTKGVLYYDELNISNGAVVDVGASPCFIFARKVSIAAGCVLHADGRGAAGGSGRTGTPGGDSGEPGSTASDVNPANAGAQGDNGAASASAPPQFYTAIAAASGGGGGAGGGGGGGGGGSGGMVLVLAVDVVNSGTLTAAGGTGGAGGSAGTAGTGVVGGNGGTAGAGAAGANGVAGVTKLLRANP